VSESSSTHVETLIEQGLALYENGDVDGAVLSWEGALNLDPSNPRANGYVDYVRLHYDVLTGTADNDDVAVDVPFGVGTGVVPDYRIAIAPFGAPAKSAAPVLDAVDEGWFLESDSLAAPAPIVKRPVSSRKATGSFPPRLVSDGMDDVEQDHLAQQSPYLADVTSQPIVDQEILHEPAPAVVASPRSYFQSAVAAFDRDELEDDEDESAIDSRDNENAAADEQTLDSSENEITLHYEASDDDDVPLAPAGVPVFIGGFEVSGEIDASAYHRDLHGSDMGVHPAMGGAWPVETVIAAPVEPMSLDETQDASDVISMAADEPDEGEVDGGFENDMSFGTAFGEDPLPSLEPPLDEQFAPDLPRVASVDGETLQHDAAMAVRSLSVQSAKDVEPNVDVFEFDADEPDGSTSAEALDESFGIVATPATNNAHDDGLPEFESVSTSIRQRDNGFITARRRKSNAPEFRMTLRTPESLDDIDLDAVGEFASANDDVADQETDFSDALPSTAGLVGITRRPLPLPLPGAAEEEIATPPPLPRLSFDIAPFAAAAVAARAATRDRTKLEATALQHGATERMLGSSSDIEPETEELPQPPRVEQSLWDSPTMAAHSEVTLRIVDQTGPTRELEVQSRAATEAEPVLSFDPIAARGQSLLVELDASTLGDSDQAESRDDRVRRRISGLLDVAKHALTIEDFERAAIAIDLALSEDPESALGQKLVHRHRETIVAGFQQYLGNMDHCPLVARPMHELASTQISPRAAFLLSRVDGNISYEELLDVSGMPRVEAYRYLCQLVMRGVLS
jgi:hypothetical protein